MRTPIAEMGVPTAEVGALTAEVGALTAEEECLTAEMGCRDILHTSGSSAELSTYAGAGHPPACVLRNSWRPWTST